MNIKIINWILKSETLNLFQGKVQNDNPVMPNRVLDLLQDLTISASHLSFEFDLTFACLREAASAKAGTLKFELLC
jgi:hypothetical protein